MTDSEATRLWACLKVLWPGDGRLAEGWQRRWRERYDGVAVETVCEALRFISDETDPIKPTFEMVDAYLAQWAIHNPGAREVAKPASPAEEEAMRQRAQKALDGDDEVDALCDWLHREQPETFAEIARQKLEQQPEEVRALISRKPFIRSRILRREVAAHARAHGLVKGGLFAEASR